MYKKFKTFREEREIIEFGKKYDELCLAIIESGIPFEQFWQKHGLPFFISGVAANEQQLLEGWNPQSWDWRGLGNSIKNSAAAQVAGAAGKGLVGAATGAAKGLAGSKLGQNVNNFFNPQNTGNGNELDTTANRKIVPPDSNEKFQEAPPAPGWFNQKNTGQVGPSANNPQPVQDPQQKPQMNAHTQKMVGQAVDEIRNQFTNVFKNLIKGFEKGGNKVGAQVAQRFYDKINKYVDASKVFSKGPMQQAQPTAGAQMGNMSQSPLNQGRTSDGYGNQLDPNTGNLVGSSSVKGGYGATPENNDPFSDDVWVNRDGYEAPPQKASDIINQYMKRRGS